MNRAFGEKTVTLAAEGFGQPWMMKRGLSSPRYTSSWDEILKIDL